MPSKQPEDDTIACEVQLDAFNSNVEANHLIVDMPRNKQARFIERIDVKPQEQPRILLGSFTADNPPIGFSVELSPDPKPAGSVVTHVASIGTPERYKLILHIANYGDKTITADVWRI